MDDNVEFRTDRSLLIEILSKSRVADHHIGQEGIILNTFKMSVGIPDAGPTTQAGAILRTGGYYDQRQMTLDFGLPSVFRLTPDNISQGELARVDHATPPDHNQAIMAVSTKTASNGCYGINRVLRPSKMNG